ncbi:lysylphosphatidylglycerol synthase transmembrane domain-containing protein [Pseudodesulfovibrio indicus]|uniref:Lysylphosphatidylglycerol synthetase n=1 Tax=Pseudodesulfovibrio indicus TaxID=1716143 RepID=A0A126QP77_9BACT|nr:lysylphosphatidylglycerol synthase transmembrane domain-containing protein [Pseudodesulfovibrio indicus]AMK11508.1 hypothetical protein AWY79_10460 [Pseudodesulfovibrio indicus]TDT89909.1 hypothetical protein EDC59_103207 [Pseudodesulfovibrio indicus]
MKTRILFILLQLAVLAACLFYLFTDVDWPSLAETFSHYSPLKALAVLATTLPIYVLMGLRLSQLSEGRITTALGMLGTLLAVAVNNVLPAKLGEFAKAVYFKRKSVLGFSQSMGIIFLERFLDVNILALTGLVAAVVFGLGLYGLPLTLAVLLCWAVLILMARRIPPQGLEPARIPSERLRRSVRQGTAAIRQAMQGRTMLRPLGSTVLLWFCNFAYLGLIPIWLMGMDLTPAQVLGIYGAVYLGLTIPGLPGGIGMTEGAMVAILAYSGMAKTDALAIALTVRAYNFIPPTLMGLLVFATSGMKASTLTHANEETQDS